MGFVCGRAGRFLLMPTDDPLLQRLDRLESKLDRLHRGDTLDVLTTAEVRAVLGIGRTKLNELIQSGQLPMWKLGGERRITRAGLEAFIREQARTAR